MEKYMITKKLAVKSILGKLETVYEIRTKVENKFICETKNKSYANRICKILNIPAKMFSGVTFTEEK